MKRISISTLILLLVISISALHSQSIIVKKLPESLIPEKNNIIHSIVKTSDSNISCFWMKEIVPQLETGSLTLLNLNKNYNTINKQEVVNNATPDDKSLPIQKIMQNKDLVLMTMSQPGMVNSDMWNRGIKISTNGKSIGSPIEYIHMKNFNSNYYAGMYPRYTFSNNNTYYACIYSSYGFGVSNENRGVWASVFDSGNKKTFQITKCIVGSIDVPKTEYYVNKYAVSDEGDLYLMASKFVENEMKSIIIIHFDRTGKEVGRESIDIKENNFRDYNITVVEGGVIITGLIEESEEQKKTQKHKSQYILKSFYSKFSNQSNKIEAYIETEYDNINKMFNENDLCFDCINVRDVIHNGEVTWVITELSKLGTANMVGWKNIYDLCIMTFDKSGNLLNINSIPRKYKNYNSLYKAYALVYVQSNSYNELYKTYSYCTFNDKLYVFYNLKNATANQDNKEMMDEYYIDVMAGSKDISCFYSTVDTKGVLTKHTDKSITDEAINFRSFTQIEKNKILVQLCASKRLAEFTLE